MSSEEMQQDTYTESGLAAKVKEFLVQFKRDGRYHYVDEIDRMMSREARYIVVDYNDLVTEHDIEQVFRQEPDEILDAFARAINEILSDRFPQYAESIRDQTRVRISNFPAQRSLRQINADVIGRMTSVSGTVISASEVKPLAKEVIYVCPDNHITQIILQKGMALTRPAKCSDPKCTHRTLRLKSDSSRFIDFQILRLQELSEDLPPGQLPHYVSVTVKQDLVDNARPGDRVILTGVVRIEQETISGVSKSDSAVYRLRLDGNNVEFMGGRDSKTQSEREQISPAEEETIRSLSRDTNIYERLINSFAPHIQGQELIKEAILLLIVGAKQRTLSDGAKIRGDINVFLVGDPGTAKSEMLKFCARIAPRGLYTSGRGSTAAGLTAAVVRDKTGIMMLEAGAVVLGDQGVVCIDEFDKMQPEDRSALHEVMEQQSASIAKGGIVATLNARTSILAAANPLLGKYNSHKNITDNINVPIPLLTRFDLIYILKDTPVPSRDEKIARHIVAMHSQHRMENRSIIDSDMLTKYLLYAKRADPKMTPEAENKIVEYYLLMRKSGDEDAMTITPRQLEGLIRLSTARARLLMKDRVEAEDAEHAIFLVKEMMADVGVDVETGEIDFGTIRGTPRSEITKLNMFMSVLAAMSGDAREAVEENSLIEELVKTDKFKEEDARDFIAKLTRDGSIYEPRPGFYRRTG